VAKAMKQLVIIVISAMICFIGCIKSHPPQIVVPLVDSNKFYAAKYIHLMGGNRIWHRYKHYYVRYTIDGDTTVYSSDTTGGITILNDTVIVLPAISFFAPPSSNYGLSGEAIAMFSSDSQMLLFSKNYGASHYLNDADIINVFYFPANDSISMIEQVSGAFPSRYGATTR
jgi:hypothetical protein